MIATFPGTERISHVSANFETSAGLSPADLLGADLERALGWAGKVAIQQALSSEVYSPANVLNLTLPIPVHPRRKVLVHRHLNRIIIELEDAPQQDNVDSAVSRTQAVIANLRRCETVQSLCDSLALNVRHLTGFDRTMVYRFEADGTGTVIAEDHAAGMEPYLDLRYPASDIPQQARRLYATQRVRCIPDVDGVPVDLLTLPQTPDDPAATEKLDMSYCALRAASTVHMQYLRNMGVRATLAVSLLQDTDLWGMIVCHHRTPFATGADLRALCDMVGQLVSVLLLRVSEAEDLSGHLARHQTIASLRNSIESGPGVIEGLCKTPDLLLKLMNAHGALIRLGGSTRLIGVTPAAEDAAAIVKAVRANHGESVSALANAGQKGGLAEHCADLASGILVMPIANNPGDAIAWFRPEVARTVSWGGDPRTPHTQGANGRISPRASFAKWTEQVRGCSAPWTPIDWRAAQDLRRTITDALLRQAETQLAQLSAYDALTGLANRRTLDTRLERWRAAESEQQAALIFIDLDRFKTINDMLGHIAGDQMLMEVAARLRHLAPAGSVAARLGGDEFVLFWPESGRSEAEKLARVLLEALDRPFDIQHTQHYGGASIGIACGQSRAPDDLLRQADAAMYAAKRSGGGKIVLFQPALHALVLTNMQIEQDLFRAVENGEMEVHYQPIVNAPGREISGFEALLRWRHPKRGSISPAEFIPLAEEAGLIKRIGGWVLMKSIRQLAAWQERGHQLTMSINVSARQLMDDSLSGMLAALLEETLVSAQSICLEVTESALMHESAVRELHRVRALGAKIAVDDFGTGYSSLAYLQSLPVTKVKIDRSFVVPLGSNPRANRFLKAIVDLAHTLDLQTVAEGVETEEQWAVASESHCDMIQGWLISKALTGDDASAWLESFAVKEDLLF
jgi:diguanylate cyclase (GGDEF)-like protein